MSSYWSRYARARISRRTLLRGSAGAATLAAAAALVGCSSGGAKPGASPNSSEDSGATDQPDLLNHAGTPRRGGRFLTSEAASFGTFDPHIGIALASAYFPRIYNVLVNQSVTRPEFIYLDLAQSFEIPDPQTYVFHIRPGVRITPNDLGVPERDMDGEDVRVNLERIKSEPAANNYGFARQFIDSVVVSGDTVTVKTTKPYAWFMNRIGLFVNTIAPRELLEGDLSRLSDKAAGAGPFRLVSVSEGDRARFDRNPNYYRNDEATGMQLPFVDGIDLSVITDRTSALAAFRAAQLHRYTAATGEEARAIGGNSIVEREPNFSFIAVTMNPDLPPFNDPRARRAMSRAIDRQQYVDIVYSGDAQANGLVPWTMGRYALDADELRTKYQPYDVQDAKALISAIGGLKFKVIYPAETPLEEHNLHLPIFFKQMQDAGIELEQDQQVLTSWIENYRKFNYSGSFSLNQIYETPEIPLDFHSRRGPLNDETYAKGLGDAEIEAAITKSKEQTELTARIDAVREAQKVIYAKDPMFLPLISPYQYEVYRPTVHDIPSGVGTTRFLLNTLWLDS